MLIYLRSAANFVILRVLKPLEELPALAKVLMTTAPFTATTAEVVTVDATTTNVSTIGSTTSTQAPEVRLQVIST